MTVRRDEYFERYREFTTREGWTEEQQLFVARIAIVGYGSSEVLERMTKEIVKIQNNIKETEFEQSLEAFDKVYHQPTLGFDSEGDYHRPNGWDVT